MANSTIEETQRFSRLAGFSYVLTILLGIFSVNFVESRLIVHGDSAATVRNILAHQLLFRIGIASEILMYVLVILLAFSLYVVLRSVHKDLAMLALLWRIGEAIIGGASVVISGIMPLLLLRDKSFFDPIELHALLKVLLDVRGAGLDIVLIFIGMGGTIFCYLFFKSGYVPRFLAVWGMLTYFIMLVLSFTSIMTPVPEIIKMICYSPGGLFELIFGFWLLFKGVNIRKSFS